jgi:antirestriction protein
MESTIKIYVACLASYNNGDLHGVWVDAAQDADMLQEEIDEMLRDSPTADAEEWRIDDYEGFGQIRLNEYESLDVISSLACGIEEHGEPFAAYADYMGDAMMDEFEDKFQGVWSTEIDFAQEIADETLNIPANIAPYFDYEAFARDLFINDYLALDVKGGIAVFIAY